MNMQNDISALRQQLQQLQSLHAAGTLDAAAYAAAKAPLERRLLDSVMADTHTAVPPPATRPGGKLIALLCTGVIGLAIAGYAYTGAPGATVLASNVSAPGANSNASEEEQFAAAVEQLAQRLQSDPDNAEGHAMLARSYARLGQHEKALPAFKKTGTLLQTDARLMADYADTLAVLNNRSLLGEPALWIDRALKLEPDNPKALALAGSGAFEAKDYKTAVRHWERLASITAPGAEFLPQLQASIDEARQLGGLGPGARPLAPSAAPAPLAVAPTAAGSAVAAAGTGVSVQGTVRLAPALAQAVQPTDTVFVFARSAEGPRMPLAILRYQVKDLPVSFTLDDSQAMAPTMRLSQHPKVVISARISKSGQATPAAGDLVGQSAPVDNTHRGLTIEINELVKN
jgi:cytochrome c-type biogenesis protein CcmH